MKLNKNVALMAVAGLAASVSAQSGVDANQLGPTGFVNLSGATLLENFIRSQAVTNDYIDVDGNGVCLNCPTFGVQQLVAPTAGPDVFHLAYRVSGSVAGYQELLDFGPRALAAECGQAVPASGWPGLFVTGDNALVSAPNVLLGDATSGPVLQAAASKLIINRGLVVDTTVSPVINTGTPQNPGGYTRLASITAGRRPLSVTGAPAAGGFRVDAAPVDVPSTWAVRGPVGSAAATNSPSSGGYGRNARVSVNAQGLSTGAGFSYLLADLGNRNLNVSAPDCNTVFDTQLAFAPIAMITNLGTGVSQLDDSEVRFIFASGRRANGENLVAVTREIGSGTRNGFNNTNALDPSFGVGENVGGAAPSTGTTGNSNLLGAAFLPSNKIGSGDMENTVRWHRLAVGYTGAERTVTLITGRRAEIVAIRNTAAGGTDFARPTLNNILNNVPGQNPQIYALGGPAIFASIGDPRSSSNAIVGKNTLGTDPANTNPAVANQYAAAFLNNISRSVDAYISTPANAANVGSPGEFAATLYILPNARKFVNNPAAPSTIVANPNFSQSLFDYLTLTAPNTSVLNQAPITSAFGSNTLNGQVPTRVTGVVYSDGVAGGASYITQGGATIAYGGNLTNRNRIAGDFNGDGLRNLNDVNEMVRAFWSRNGGPAWVAPNGTGAIAGAPGTDAIIEVLGDFNGDGNFNREDVRYFADGLAIDPATGNLDRKKGFEAVDNAWNTLGQGNNFFGTQLVGPGGPVSYVVGASRFDVANDGTGARQSAPARGWAPVGWDGRVNATDRAYIAAQFGASPVVWGVGGGASSLATIVNADLSADMTGELTIDQADLNAYDALFGAPACYANCDGSTNAPILNALDFSCFLQRYVAGDSYANCDGSTNAPVLNALDFSCFLTRYVQGCN